MPNVFDSHDVALLSRALDKACRQFEAAGGVNGDDDSIVRAALTRAIVEAAEQGEREEDRLAAYAVANYERSKNGIMAREAAAPRN